MTPTNKGMRITVDPGYATQELHEAGWDKQHIMVVYDRLIALAKAGESYIDVSRRLNPAKVTQPAWTPKFDRERVLLASRGHDLGVSELIRGGPNRQNT